MRQAVQFAHALADETRWRIVQLLCEDALCVCELADILKMPQSSVSSHLQVIRKAGMIANERCEKWIYYRLHPQFRSLLAAMSKHFAASTATDATLARDARLAVRRLAQREESCCPGPRKLASTARKKLAVPA